MAVTLVAGSVSTELNYRLGPSKVNKMLSLRKISKNSGTVGGTILLVAAKLK